MAREWVKLYTRLLDDADLNGLSAETGWNWTRMIVLAGRNEDNGRIGTPKNVAYVLHTTPASIIASVAEVDGRIIVAEDGELWFRDWQDWQSQSERERQRAHRAGKAGVTDDEQSEPVTDGHDQSQGVTDGHVSEKRLDQRSSEPTTDSAPIGAGADAPPATTTPAVESIPAEAESHSEPPMDASEPEPAAAPPKPSSNGKAPRPPTLHQLLYGAVCQACGLDPGMLDSETQANVGKLATACEQREVPPEYVAECGERWVREKFSSRRPASAVTPPKVAQLRTWIGECKTADAAKAAERSAIVAADEDDERAEPTVDASDASTALSKALGYLRDTTVRGTFDQWYAKLDPVSLSNGVLTLRAPSVMVADLVNRRGGLASIQGALVESGMPRVAVVVLAPEAAVWSVAE